MTFGSWDFVTIVNAVLIVGLLISVTLSILAKDLLKAAISLGVASAILGAIFYLLGAPLAAMIEVSVCGGLVTVLFVTVINMTGDASEDEEVEGE